MSDKNVQADDVQRERLLREQIMDMAAIIWPEEKFKIIFLSQNTKQTYTYYAGLVSQKSFEMKCGGRWEFSTLDSTQYLFRHLGSRLKKDYIDDFGELEDSYSTRS